MILVSERWDMQPAVTAKKGKEMQTEENVRLQKFQTLDSPFQQSLSLQHKQHFRDYRYRYPG